MLGRFQIRLAQHAGQIGTSDLNKRHRELGANRLLNRRPRCRPSCSRRQPASYRHQKDHGEPARPRPGRHKHSSRSRTRTAAHAGAAARRSLKSQHQARRGGAPSPLRARQTCSALAVAPRSRGPGADELEPPGPRRGRRIPVALGGLPAPIATPEIENLGACWLQGSHNQVEVLPPSRISHAPEPYPYRSRTDTWHSADTTILVLPSSSQAPIQQRQPVALWHVQLQPVAALCGDRGLRPWRLSPLISPSTGSRSFFSVVNGTPWHGEGSCPMS